MVTVKPQVTVIIPAYGNHLLLLETIHSVYQQNGNFKLQVLVVDDNSPIPLEPIIRKSFPKVTVIRNSRNLKSGPSRNQALKNLKTDYVAFLDADDIWKPNFLLTSINAIGVKNIGSVCLSQPLCSSDLFLSFKVKIYLLSALRDVFQYFFYFVNRNKLPQSAFYLCQLSHLVFDYKKISNLHFDKAYNFGGEDWKFTLECLDQGSIEIIPQRLVRYRYHKKSATQKKVNLRKKWQSYTKLLYELKKRRISGPMTYLFEQYINLFK